MFLHDITRTEDDPSYQRLESDNLDRQYDFLFSVIAAALGVGHRKVSAGIINALNYHAIACLHRGAGELRIVPIEVGGYRPPHHDQVPALMDEFIELLNRNWETASYATLATYALWRLNFIHPFVNGNGRTARALCYYIICVKSGGLLRGAPALPELMRRKRREYVRLLQHADSAYEASDPNFLSDLHDFVMRLLEEQTGIK